MSRARWHPANTKKTDPQVQLDDEKEGEGEEEGHSCEGLVTSQLGLERLGGNTQLVATENKRPERIALLKIIPKSLKGR